MLIREKVQEGRIGKLSGFTKYLSLDKEVVFAQVYYLGSKFIIEKSFQNTISGKMEMKSFLKKFRKDEDILSYFNIKGKIKMSIEKIIEEIKVQKVYADEVLEDGNPGTAAFREGRKNSAKEALLRLSVLYKENLRKNIVSIVSGGTLAPEFCETAEKLLEMPSVKYSVLVDDIVNTFSEDNLNGRNNTDSILDGINSALSQVYAQLDIDGQYLEYNTQMDRTFTTKEDLSSFVSDMIDTHIGSDLKGLYAVDKACQAALSSLYSGERFAFTVPTATSQEADAAYAVLSKISPNARIVVAGRQGRGLANEPTSKIKEVSEDSVMEALNQVKESIKTGGVKHAEA